MKAPLEIIDYFFPHIQVTADPLFDVKSSKIPHYEVKSTVGEGDQDGLYQVVVEISSLPENDETRQAYAVQLVVVGIFRITEANYPDSEKLLKITGASILYSAAREFLITVTSRGPWSKTVLPTVSFLRAHDHDSGEKPPSSPKTSVKKKTTRGPAPTNKK